MIIDAINPSIKTLLLRIFIIIGVFFLINPFHVVEGGTRGVSITLGTIKNEPLNEGLHIIVPLITKVKDISIRVEKNEIQTQAASKDLQNLSIQAVISWQVSPESVTDIYRKYGDLNDLASRLILPETLSAIKAETTKLTAEQILQQRQKLENSILKEIRSRVVTEGVTVATFNISNFEFSKEFGQAIEDKQVAQQQAQKAFYLTEKAKNEAQALREKAKGEADAEIERARGISESQTMIAKTLNSEILHRQWINKWDGKLPSTLAGSNANFLLSLPNKGTPTPQNQ
jgi:regulator of protease activity HflC (stomatin/prohibitin superfamily)